jgi:TolB-like protein
LTGERRLAAIMFTDIVGYTSMAQRDERGTMDLLTQHNAMLRRALQRFGGREVKTIGDSFLVEFPSALEAVECALEVQRLVKERNEGPAPESGRFELRIGVHAGEVIASGGDILGDAVNVSSRVQTLAEPGGICISGQVYEHVRNKADVEVEKLTEPRLKNVSAPVDVYRVVLPWARTKAQWTPRQDRKRIAVLPLANISQDSNDEYFADGMTEELINTLSHVNGLGVIARTSVIRYKDNPKPISEVGRELGVGSVLEGSVRRSGNRVRVTAQLIDVATEEHLWSENYDRTLEDVFEIQSEVALRVADSLKAKLLDSERKRLKAGYTSNPEAHEMYLLAKHGRTNDPHTKIRRLEEAIALDPRFALAYAELANYYTEIAGDFIPLKEAVPKAKELLSRALELDDELALAWTAKGNMAYQYDWDIGEAERCFRKAIELNPNEPEAYSWYGALCVSVGRGSDALELTQKARALDPLSARTGFLGVILAALGMNKEAVKECELLKEAYRGDMRVFLWRAATFSFMRMWDEAVKEMDELRTEIRRARERGALGWTAGVPSSWYTFGSFVYAAAGRQTDIMEMIREAEDAMRGEYVDSFDLGKMYLAAGAKEKAFALFDEAVQERDPGPFMFGRALQHYVSIIPALSESVGSDPRFVAFLRRVGLA